MPMWTNSWEGAVAQAAAGRADAYATPTAPARMAAGKTLGARARHMTMGRRSASADDSNSYNAYPHCYFDHEHGALRHTPSSVL